MLFFPFFLLITCVQKNYSGELPPYFIARAARLSGGSEEEVEEGERVCAVLWVRVNIWRSGV